MTRTSGLDFGSDPAHQWDTKRELFHRAEECASLMAILFCAGYFKKLWMDPDEIWWAGWVCDKDERI